MGILYKILHIVDGVSEWAGKVVMWLIPAIIVATVFEVMARYAFRQPTQWAYEVGRMLAGAAVALGGAYTFIHGVHVNVDVLYNRSSPRRRAIMDLVTSVAFFAFCVALLWFSWQQAWHSTMIREVSIQSAWKFPLYPVKLTLPVGCVFLILSGAAKFVRSIITAFTGKEIAR